MYNIKDFRIDHNFETYNKFLDYFYNLDSIEKDYIIYNCYNYLMYDKKVSHKSLEKISNMYDILKHKIKYDKLNPKERRVYEYIQAYLIYTDRYKKTECFDIYVEKYLSNLYLDNIGKKIFLVIQDILNNLNKEFNLDTDILLCEDDEDTMASVQFEELEKNIYLNSVYFDDLYDDNLVIDGLVGYVSYILAIILHEYRHIIQKTYIFNNDDKKSEDYEMDFYLIQYGSLYSNYHNYFIGEKDANDFATERLISVLKKYFRNKEINEEDILKDIELGLTYYNKKTEKKFLKMYKLKLLTLKALMYINLEPQTIKNVRKHMKEMKYTVQNEQN